MSSASASRDPRGVVNMPASRKAYRPAATLGSQQANAQADKGWLRQMLTDERSIYGPMVNPPSRALTGAAPDHTDAYALKAEELFFRSKATIDHMGVSRELQGHRRNTANESIHGFTNLRAVGIGRNKPGTTPAGKTGVSQDEKDKTELSFIEAEKNVVPMGIIVTPDSEADTGSGNTQTHLNAVLTLRNTSNVDWPAGALGAYRFPRPWELPQGADVPSSKTGVRPTAWLVPVDRKTFEWDQRAYFAQSLDRVLHAADASGAAGNVDAYLEQDRALSLTAGADKGLILLDETDRVWYHLLVAEATRIAKSNVPRGFPVRPIIVEIRSLVEQWQFALNNAVVFQQTLQRMTMALRGLVGKFDSTIVCRFLTSAPKGGEAEVYWRS